MGLLSKLNYASKRKSKISRNIKKEPLVEREKEEINNLNSRIAELEERINLNKEDKKHARRENEKLKDQLKDQLEAQRQEIRNLENQLQNEKKDLETERSYRQLTESEKESLSKQLQILKKELEDTRNQVEEDTKKHRNKLEETQKLYEEEKKKYFLAVKERDRSLTEEKKSSIAKAELADLRKHIECLEEEKETIRKVTESDKASLSEELQKSKKDLDNKRKQFEEDTKKYRNELEETMKLYDTEKKHFTSALAERDKYKQDRDTLEHTLDNAKKELENVKKEITLTRSSTNENKSSNAESELADLKKECKGIKQEMENIMKSVDEWKSKLDTLEAELKKEREKSTRNQIREKESLKEENEKLVKALQNVQATIAEERSKFKEYMHSQEEMLADTLNEHERAKQESNTQLNLARKPADEWKSKLDTVEAELKKERGKVLGSNPSEMMGRMERHIKQTDLENRYTNNEHILQNIIEDCRRKLADSEQAKEECLTRLSSLGQVQTFDDVTLLSDPNRPTKLAQYYNEMYDEHWTDATEALEEIIKNDEKGIKILLDLLILQKGPSPTVNEHLHTRDPADGTDTLVKLEGSRTSLTLIESSSSNKETYKYCKGVGETQLKLVEDDIVLPPLDNASSNIPDAQDQISKLERVKMPEIFVQIRNGIMKYIKCVAKHVSPLIEIDVLTQFKKSNQFGDDVLDACKNYITRCVELCWLMRVQDPPVALSWSVPDDRVFQDEFYRAYTKKGSHVQYVVWPSMHLSENGPILVKGVAQGARR